MDNRLLDYSPETEMFEAHHSQWMSQERSGVLSETAEIGLALQFLTIRSQRALDHFLMKLMRCVLRNSGRTFDPLMRDPLLRDAMHAALDHTAKIIFHTARRAPSACATCRLASVAGRLFALELEGLSDEDREFEAARRCVRLLSDAVARAPKTAGAIAAPAVRNAVLAAAKHYAPGMLAVLQTNAAAGQGRRTFANIDL